MRPAYVKLTNLQIHYIVNKLKMKLTDIHVVANTTFSDSNSADMERLFARCTTEKWLCTASSAR